MWLNSVHVFTVCARLEVEVTTSTRDSPTTVSFNWPFCQMPRRVYEGSLYTLLAIAIK